MVCTAGNLVEKRIIWPHEVVYTATGKELPIPPFVHGYILVMQGEKELVRAKMASHLEDLMGDLEIYGWERVRASH